MTGLSKIARWAIPVDVMNRIQDRGMGWVAKRITIIACLLTPAVILRLILLTIKPMLHIRIGVLRSERLGTFAMFPEIYLCERDHGAQPSRSLDVWFHSDQDSHMLLRPKHVRDTICNQQLNKMWERTLNVKGSSKFLFRLNQQIPWGRQAFLASNTHPHGHDQNGALSRYPAHLKFTESEEERGWLELEKMGISSDSKFVCFHARDSAYLDTARPRNLELHGDWRWQTNNPKVIDYATKYQTDFLDVFLSAKCSFFVGQSNGMTALPMIFRTPMVFVNIFPIWDVKYCQYSTALMVPKKYFSQAWDRYLSFREVFDLGLGLTNIKSTAHQRLFTELGIRIDENSPAEITEATIEMHRRIDGDFKPSAEDRNLQSRFISAMKYHFDGIPSASEAPDPVAAAYFLRTNAALLD